MKARSGDLPVDELAENRRRAECWVVSDGRAGMENQALGLAEAAARLTPLRVVPKRIVVKAPWRGLPGALWGDPFSHLSPDGALLRPPFPALWIACGRLTAPFTLAVKRRDPEVFTVQTQAPRAPLGRFDLVVPPLHDRLSGANVFSIVGSPGRVTKEALGRDAALLAPTLTHLGTPRVAVLIGGANRAYRMTHARAAELAGALARLADEGAGLMITTSRRTDPAIAQTIRSALGERPHFFWTGGAVSGLSNPYFGMLGLADHIMVTRDSVNMAAEAAATGKPVHVISLDRAPFSAASAKFERFHQALEQRGAARPFTGTLEPWTYPPLEETQRAAEELVRRFAAARGVAPA